MHSLSGDLNLVDDPTCVTCALKLFTFQSIIMVMTPTFSFVFPQLKEFAFCGT